MNSSKLLAANELPAEWESVRLRWLSKRYAGGTPDTKNADYWEGGSIPWLKSGAVNQGTITQPSGYITELALQKSSAKWIPRGALVMALAGQGKTKAMVGYLDIQTTGNQSLAAIVPEKIDGKYLYWWLSSQYLTIRNLSSQDGREGLNLDMIGNIVCPVPPLETQRRIARFLDEKTARIDTLIEKRRELLDRLTEKRHALIRRAVTGGLNPKVPHRHSGTPWLGKVPAHWGIVPLRFLVDFTGGATPDTRNSEYWKGEIPWVSPKDMKQNAITDTLDHISAVALSETNLRLIDPGAILIVVRGMILAHSFPVAINRLPVTINQDMKALRCYESLAPQYLLAFFQAFEERAVALADVSAHGTRRLDTTVLGRLKIPLPPLPEQKQAVTYIDKSAERINALHRAVVASITLLKERREVLIVAAVTGQIEVEGVV